MTITECPETHQIIRIGPLERVAAHDHRFSSSAEPERDIRKSEISLFEKTGSADGQNNCTISAGPTKFAVTAQVVPRGRGSGVCYCRGLLHVGPAATCMCLKPATPQSALAQRKGFAALMVVVMRETGRGACV